MNFGFFEYWNEIRKKSKSGMWLYLFFNIYYNFLFGFWSYSMWGKGDFLIESDYGK